MFKMEAYSCTHGDPFTKFQVENKQTFNNYHQRIYKIALRNIFIQQFN